MCNELENLLKVAKDEKTRKELTSLFKNYKDGRKKDGNFFTEREWDSLVSGILSGTLTEIKKEEYDLVF